MLTFLLPDLLKWSRMEIINKTWIITEKLMELKKDTYFQAFCKRVSHLKWFENNLK